MDKPSPHAVKAAAEIYPAAKDWDFMREADVAQAIERAAIAPAVAEAVKPLVEALRQMHDIAYRRMGTLDAAEVEDFDDASRALAPYRREG